jgi:type II secretory pathway pseudopilin PulG
LLVVVAIIAVLASLLLPALTKARTRTKITTCMNDKRNLYLAIAMYAGDASDSLPSQGMTVAQGQTIWSGTRWHSELMLQNDVRSGTPATTDPGFRYWGLGRLWTGGYLGDGRFLYCTDDQTARFVSGAPTGQNTGSYKLNFFKSGHFYLDDATDWGRFPSHTLQSVYYVSPWYLSEAGIIRTLSSTMGAASSLVHRDPSWPVAVDGHFRGGAQWSQPVPHAGMGVTRVATDGHADLQLNPQPTATDWAITHPWNDAASYLLSKSVVIPMK